MRSIARQEARSTAFYHFQQTPPPVPLVDAERRVIGIVTVDDVIDAIVAEDTEDAQKFGGVEALQLPYMKISFGRMIHKRRMALRPVSERDVNGERDAAFRKRT
jgi:Mg/Co/Ni transporter MgtE